MKIRQLTIPVYGCNITLQDLEVIATELKDILKVVIEIAKMQHEQQLESLRQVRR